MDDIAIGNEYQCTVECARVCRWMLLRVGGIGSETANADNSEFRLLEQLKNSNERFGLLRTASQ